MFYIFFKRNHRKKNQVLISLIIIPIKSVGIKKLHCCFVKPAPLSIGIFSSFSGFVTEALVPASKDPVFESHRSSLSRFQFIQAHGKVDVNISNKHT